MCKIIYFLLIVGLVLHLAECAPPSWLSLCKVDDTKCIKSSTNVVLPFFVDGMPEYGVEVLDPLKMKSINATEGNLFFTLSDITVFGLRSCKATKVTRDVKNSKMFLRLECTASMKGQYVLKGALVVPVEGHGNIYVNLKSIVLDLDIDIVQKKADDGKRHWNIKSFANTFELKEKSELVFENLNKHNEVLRKASADLLRESSNDVVKEIGPPVFTALINRVFKNVNRFFKALSIEELSLA